MKQNVTKEESICDFCKTNSSREKCLRCGKDVCWQCKDKSGVAYEHAVWMQGTLDGFYCTPCDIALSETKDDPTHQAYSAVRALRAEYETWSKDFDARQRAAEAKVSEFYYARTNDLPL